MIIIPNGNRFPTYYLILSFDSVIIGRATRILQIYGCQSQRSEVVIMAVSNEKQLFRVVEEHVSDRVKAELLSFWGRHPSDEFTVNVVSCTLGFSKLEVNRALKHLIEVGFVETHTRDGVVFYHLTADEKK
jgi:hypothetical protein